MPTSRGAGGAPRGAAAVEPAVEQAVDQRRGRRFVWDDEEDGGSSYAQQHDGNGFGGGGGLEKKKQQDADPGATFLAIQRKVAEMMEELRSKRSSVRERQHELKRVRADAANEMERRGSTCRRKADDAQRLQRATVLRHEALLKTLREDVRGLRARMTELAARSDRSSSLDTAKLEAARAGLTTLATKQKEAWAVVETRELSGVVEKRREGIKAKVIKALEPEVHRLITQNREESKKRREAQGRDLKREKLEREAESENFLLQERRRLEDEMETDLASLRRTNSKKLRELHEQSERDVAELWESQKRSLETERQRHEDQRSTDEARQKLALGSMERDWLTKEKESRVRHDKARREEAGQTQEIQEEANQRRFELALKRELVLEPHAADLGSLLKPVERKCAEDLAVVIGKLDAQSKADLAELEAVLVRERAELAGTQTNTLDEMKAREATAVEAQMDAATSRNETARTLESTERATTRLTALTRGLLDELAAPASSEASSAAKAQRTLLSQRAAAAKTTSGLEGRCGVLTDEFLALRQAIADADAGAATKLEARRREHAADLENIELKIHKTLTRKRSAKDALLGKLARLQQASADKEEEMNRRRQAHVDFASPQAAS